ncbi:hypothetical protein [Mobiluncus mulieris]|uniref:hypothetical protein n=1 Tax=Mobiluncus mulieris TaxID=2052 RepID=UPI0020166502|nr:hypothetical protein [Mobiluncus mulieris]
MNPPWVTVEALDSLHDISRFRCVRMPLTGELTLPGKIILEAEAGNVIFLIVDGGRPIKFKNRTPAGGSESSVTE